MSITRILAIALLVSFLPGCDLFKPAVPQAPVGGGISLNYSGPDTVLQTLARGVQAKAQGAAAYTGAFADSVVDGVPYYASFDPEVVRRYRATGREVPIWNLSLERAFFANDLLAIRSEPYAMQWSHDEDLLTDERDDQTATLYRRYRIYAVASDGTTIAFVALGLADLTLRKTSAGRWAIVRWDDHADLSPSSDPNPADDRYDLTLGARRLGVR